jgi:hypothetical protein
LLSVLGLPLRKTEQAPVIPCCVSPSYEKQVDWLASRLFDLAHSQFPHMSRDEFARSGLFEGTIEKLRGRNVATTGHKTTFVEAILSYLQEQKLIQSWAGSGGKERSDYRVWVNGIATALEAKGCLDGNSATIYDRPDDVSSLVLWSLCQNAASSPPHSIWSGLHTRLSANIIATHRPVDGLLMLDPLCNCAARPCPKMAAGQGLQILSWHLPSPCIYLLPGTAPSLENPSPPPNRLADVPFLAAIAAAFSLAEKDVYRVEINVRQDGASLARQTRILQDDRLIRESDWTKLRRAVI